MRRNWIQETEEASIDMSPLIDMVFILLIFFMVSTTFVKDMKLDLSRPGASSAKPASTKSLRIHIDRFQNIYLNNEKIQPWTIQGKLRDQIRDNKSQSLLVITDEKVQVDRVIEVVDQARLAGVVDIGIATKNEGQ
ncbi:MAG: biopolymer transporter ExbD [Bdellovibrionales bacterium]|nr:biopolymer transporter ExbD [Bdellovibrionales bacterium]